LHGPASERPHATFFSNQSFRRQDMFHFYDGYHFFGMHMLWWLFWLGFIAIGFGMFEPVRRRRGDGRN
jgi:hypothetical protein